MPEGQETAQDFYGGDAIIGRAEEPNKDPLAGRDVKITTTGTQTVEVNEDDPENPEGGQKGSEGADKGDQENPESDPESEAQAEVDKTLQAEKDAKKVLADKGVDWAGLEAEFNASGQLSDDSYAKLEKAGFPRSVVDAYVAGQQAVAERFVNSVIGYAGGKQQFEAITKFITSRGKAEVETFNDLIENGKLSVIKTAIEGYKARMVSKFGTNNPSLLGGASNAPAVQGFASKDEMIKAMSDKRYGHNKAYTLEVESKVEKSKFIKVR